MKVNLSQWYKILAPRAVVLVSTVNSKGVSNAAPFSFVMPCSINPPLITFASAPDHHTVENISETKDFVVNIPAHDIVKQLWACAEDLPAGVSEIKKAGLTEEKSDKIKSPRIKECIGHFECKLDAQYEAGDHVIIVGKVVVAEVKDEYMSGKKYLVEKSNSLMHISGPSFGLLGKVIEV